MNHSLQTLQERRWLPVKMIFFGIFVGIVAAFVTVLYRFMLQFAEAILFRMIEFTDGHPFYMAIWLLCLMLLAFLVAKITAWESMCSGSGIPQVQGEIKGFFDVNWWKLLISKMIGGTFCIIGGLSLGLFYCLAFVDDGGNVLVERAKSLDAHQRPHGFLVGHQAAQGVVVHVHQQGTLPATGQQGGTRAAHGHVQYAAGIYLLHVATVIGQHRQEADEFLHLAFGR